MNGNGVIGTTNIGALQQALGKAVCDIPEYISYLKIKAMKEQKPGLITPGGNGKHGIMDFIRGR